MVVGSRREANASFFYDYISRCFKEETHTCGSAPPENVCVCVWSSTPFWCYLSAALQSSVSIDYSCVLDALWALERAGSWKCWTVPDGVWRKGIKSILQGRCRRRRPVQRRLLNLCRRRIVVSATATSAFSSCNRRIRRCRKSRSPSSISRGGPAVKIRLVQSTRSIDRNRPPCRRLTESNNISWADRR